MGDTNFPIEEVFNSAVSIVQNLPKEGPIKPSDALKLKLYAYFKQATQGPNVTPKPRFYQVVESYKWDAWKKLGDMTKEDAMSNYIEELRQIMKTIPEQATSVEDDKHFEDVLGKKFYDYWFNQWKQSISKPQQPLATTVDKKSLSFKNELQQTDIQRDENDKHGNSSIETKISKLDEETTSIKSDGYKTPSISSFKGTCTDSELTRYFTSALLKLHRNLLYARVGLRPNNITN